MSKKANSLKVNNARENNLKGISLDIPHDALTVVTGLSGSGKSSLAFDTVYAEGQRRYIETFSPYTRQFFDKVKKPEVENLHNVRPAVAIQQRTRVTNSRSTVGSMTNINDFLKLLWANLATPVCPECGIELKAWTAPELTAVLLKLKSLKPESTFLIGASVRAITPKTSPKKTKKKKEKVKETASAARVDLGAATRELTAMGLSRALNAEDGTLVYLDDEETPAPWKEGRLILILDRIKAGSTKTDQKRVLDSINQAFSLYHQRLPSGLCADSSCLVVEFPAETGVRPFLKVLNSPDSENIRTKAFTINEYSPFFCCPSGRFTLQKSRPALFSFNHPMGACPECRGFGKMLSVDERLCIPNPTLSISQGAVQCWAGKAASMERRELASFCAANGIDINKPWQELPQEARDLIFNQKTKEYWGIRHWFKWLERKAYKMHVRVFLSRYRSQVDCPTCRGSRLKPEALAFQVKGKTLPHLWNLPVGDLAPWIEGLRKDLASSGKLTRPLDELFFSTLSRLHFLVDLGLPYLTLERQARTLSGGETQRVNLATALGSELISTQFVLDEPSVGLHPRDTRRLIDSVKKLTARGNSLLVVEHDLDCINAADHIIELGPEAGEHGGQVVYSGPVEKWRGIEVKEEPNVFSAPPATDGENGFITVKNATVRNLKGFDLEIPLGKFVCLTGVSGSGKSTLITEVLNKAWESHKIGLKPEGNSNLVTGFSKIAQLLLVDQSALSKTPRANIATYCGVWDEVRDLLSEAPGAQALALSRSSFSFNVDGGRCPECKGAGHIREDMQFLSDVYVQCEVCLGKRFQPPVLSVHYKGKNVSDILGMTIETAAEFFKESALIKETAYVLSQLGLGHLTLGHALSDLSGGEAQRLKLVPFVQKSGTGRSLLIFDEPSTGLHYRDVLRLVDLFRLLRERGHSILCVEHNLTLVAACDWIIDLGPEGGEKGGAVLLEGHPSTFLNKAGAGTSYTAMYLKEYIDNSAGKTNGNRGNGSLQTGATLSPALTIKGAREHNLKNLDVRIPLNCTVALTGVSGSGKSSIAKDIVYAESQRRYLDCLSPYARQFIKELKKPEIDHIENVKPAICVYQHTFQPSRLSTVATMSEIYNFLRLLYSKTGVQYCPDHPEAQIAPLSSAEIAKEIKKLKDKSVRILAPVIKMKKGNHREVFERAISSEISQIRVDGVFLNPAAVNSSGGLLKTKAHTIEFVVAKFNPAQIDIDLIKEASEQALTLGNGTLIVKTEKEELFFSTERTCPICKQGFFKPDPEDLSFNSKRGRCPECDGYGRTDKGAVCPECNGARINSIGRNIRIEGLSIFDLCSLNAKKLTSFFSDLIKGHEEHEISGPIISEIRSRLQSLLLMGLDHLALSRDCSSLSSGELQRLRLATAMGSALSGVLYIFDEPSAGLHPLDNKRVLSHLETLKKEGNSVIMIEHDADSILASDYVLELGPGGGRQGGQIVFEGQIESFKKSKTSPTSLAIKGNGIELKDRPQAELPATGGKIKISGGAVNNIKNLNLSLPLGKLLVVAGVSGAGKSSLVHGIINHTVSGSADGKKTSWSSGHGEVKSDIPFSRILEVDQKPIGINSRSTPASYLGVWDEIRKLFAGTSEARIRGWANGYFSYNSGKGRCPECKGLGQIKLEMSFLPDAEVLCETCRGNRFTEEAESVRYLGLSPGDVLKLTFEEAKSIFSNHRKIHRSLHTACELGLGYLTLGQSSTTLSGGESQRIKLVEELSLAQKGHTLYILDEPTTGLHKLDVSRLIRSLRELVARGNSIIVIEHDSDVIKASDYLIELGPGPGEQGGKVIFAGDPDSLKKAETPWADIFRQENL